jgi:hypothetical protein
MSAQRLALQLQRLKLKNAHPVLLPGGQDGELVYAARR